MLTPEEFMTIFWFILVSWLTFTLYCVAYELKRYNDKQQKGAQC